MRRVSRIGSTAIRSQGLSKGGSKLGAVDNFGTTTIAQQSIAKKESEATPNADSSPVAKTALVPPLTISQFRILLAVHNMAAQSGRMEIAARALGASLRGGMPVSDPDTSAPDPRRNLIAASGIPQSSRLIRMNRRYRARFANRSNIGTRPSIPHPSYTMLCNWSCYLLIAQRKYVPSSTCQDWNLAEKNPWQLPS